MSSIVIEIKLSPVKTPSTFTKTSCLFLKKSSNSILTVTSHFPLGKFSALKMPPHFPLGKSSLTMTQLFPLGNYFTLTKTSHFPFTQLCNYFCTHWEPTSAHIESLLLHTLRAYFRTHWEPTSALSESLLLHTLRAYFCTQWEPTATQVRACVFCVWNTKSSPCNNAQLLHINFTQQSSTPLNHINVTQRSPIPLNHINTKRQPHTSPSNKRLQVL